MSDAHVYMLLSPHERVQINFRSVHMSLSVLEGSINARLMP